ncbi:hypothetical protein GCM10025734_12240 [Kitasatospora paranensis]
MPHGHQRGRDHDVDGEHAPPGVGGVAEGELPAKYGRSGAIAPQTSAEATSGPRARPRSKKGRTAKG